MKNHFFKITFLAFLMGIIANDIIGSIAVRYEMQRDDLMIQELLLKEENYKLKKLPVTKERLSEKMEVINLTKDYIRLRQNYPSVSRQVKIGSDNVLVQMTKCMMYEALEKDIAKSPILVIKEEPNGNPNKTEKR